MAQDNPKIHCEMAARRDLCKSHKLTRRAGCVKCDTVSTVSRTDVKFARWKGVRGPFVLVCGILRVPLVVHIRIPRYTVCCATCEERFGLSYLSIWTFGGVKAEMRCSTLIRRYCVFRSTVTYESQEDRCMFDVICDLGADGGERGGL